MKDVILIGFGGHAKSVADCLERQGLYHIIGYTDLKQYDCRYLYLGTDEVLPSYYKEGIKNVVLGVGYLGKSDIRQKIYQKLKKIGFNFPVIADPSAIISESAEIGEGVFIGKGSIINSEARIGKMSIINTKALVEHECKVGEFSHIAVAAVLCGQVEVGDAAFVGANATVIQCRKVLSKQIVPAGSVIR